MRRPCRQWRHIDRGPAGRASERGIPRLSARSRWKQAGRGCPSGFLIIFRAEENRPFGAVLLNGYTHSGISTCDAQGELTPKVISSQCFPPKVKHRHIPERSSLRNSSKPQGCNRTIRLSDDKSPQTCCLCFDSYFIAWERRRSFCPD